MKFLLFCFSEGEKAISTSVFSPSRFYGITVPSLVYSFFQLLPFHLPPAQFFLYLKFYQFTKLKSLGITALPWMGCFMNTLRICLLTSYLPFLMLLRMFLSCDTMSEPCPRPPPIGRYFLFPQRYSVPCSTLDFCMTSPMFFLCSSRPGFLLCIPISPLLW